MVYMLYVNPSTAQTYITLLYTNYSRRPPNFHLCFLSFQFPSSPYDYFKQIDFKGRSPWRPSCSNFMAMTLTASQHHKSGRCLQICMCKRKYNNWLKCISSQMFSDSEQTPRMDKHQWEHMHVLVNLLQ